METKDKDQVVFYYNRERRLENASANARFAVDHYGARRPGIIRSLTATRSLTYLFFALVFSIVAVFVVGYVQNSRKSGSVGGNSLTVAAMWFEGHVYVTVKRTSSWLPSARSDPSARAVLDIVAGDGMEFSRGTLQPGQDEIRLRFPAETKPGYAVVRASIAGTVAGDGDDGDAGSVDLVARVE